MINQLMLTKIKVIVILETKCTKNNNLDSF